MKNKKDPAFTRKLISLVMPIAFQQFMLALVSASDALMLGVIDLWRACVSVMPSEIRN